MCRHLSQGSLKSKSSTSSSRKSSGTYENNVIPVRKQLLLKGSKNFKEPLERTKSAPKLCSILEELSSEDEDNFFGERVPFDESFSISEEQFHVDVAQQEEGEQVADRQEDVCVMHEINCMVPERLSESEHNLQWIRSENVENQKCENDFTTREKVSDCNEKNAYVLKGNQSPKQKTTQVDTFLTSKLNNGTTMNVQLRPTTQPAREHQSLCERFKHILVNATHDQNIC